MLEMPPLEVAITALETSEADPNALFMSILPTIYLDGIIDICKEAYKNLENNISAVDFLVVNGVLFCVFEECAMLSIPPYTREQYGSLADLCCSNLDTAFANLPFFLSPSIENIRALMLGSYISIDRGQPTVAWEFIVPAANLCLAAGLHDANASAHKTFDTVSRERALFWNVYQLEKSLCLRLNRGSCIPDHDISIPHGYNFHLSSDLAEEVSEMTRPWIRASIAQGQIYEKLYSPAARASSAETRMAYAKAIAAECQSLLSMTVDIRQHYPSRGDIPTMWQIYGRYQENSVSVCLTLVYQAVCSIRDSEVLRHDCLEAARRAIRIQKRSKWMLELGSYFDTCYVNWLILHMPFAPFFVLLRHVLETLSIEDLVLLQDFIESLSPTLDVSTRLRHFYQMCQIMCEFASLYIRVKLKINYESSAAAAHMVNSESATLEQQQPRQQRLDESSASASLAQGQMLGVGMAQSAQGEMGMEAKQVSSDLGYGQQGGYGVVGMMETLPQYDDLLMEMPTNWSTGFENILNMLQDELQHMDDPNSVIM